MSARAHRAGAQSQPRRPAGPLAFAAAALVLAIVTLLVFKQWFVLPEPMRSEQALPAEAPPVPAPEAGAGREARMPPSTIGADGLRPAPPLAVAEPPAGSDRPASSGAARNVPERDRSGGEPAAGRPESVGPAATPVMPERLESKAPTPPASPLPAASDPRSTVSTGRTGRLADKPPSESAQSRPSRPAPASCRGTFGLALAQCRACDRLDVLQRAFCNERTRLAYCTGRWGRTADCPAPVVTTPN